MYYHLNSASQFILAILMVSMVDSFGALGAPIGLIGAFLACMAIIRTLTYGALVFFRYAYGKLKSKRVAA